MRSYYERNKGMWERIARSQKINDARLAERVNKDELKRKRTTQGNLEKYLFILVFIWLIIYISLIILRLEEKEEHI